MRDIESIVSTNIVKRIRTKDQKEHKGYHRPEVKAGTEIYLIAYELGGYFTYSYLKLEDAELSRNNSIKEGTNTFRFYDFNVVSNVDQTITK